MPFDSLPIEIVLSVFECLPKTCLPQCAAVSKLWKALVVPLIWRSISITLRPLREDPFLKALKQSLIDVTNFTYITSLTVTCELVIGDAGQSTKYIKQVREGMRNYKLLCGR